MYFIEFPSSWIFSGPSKSGKTMLLVKIILQHKKRFSKIVWINTSMSAIPDEIRFLNEVEIHTEMPENFDVFPDGSAIILDDGMLECDTKNVCELFTRGSHHKK